MDKVEITIPAVNHSLCILKHGVNKLQQSQSMYFNQFKRDLKERKTKYNKLIIRFNLLQARVVQDIFELTIYLKLVREYRESIDKRIQELENSHLLLITELKNLRNKSTATTLSPAILSTPPKCSF